MSSSNAKSRYSFADLILPDVTYASYNDKYANAVQDAVIIVLSNCTFEVVAAFAVFGVVGFLGIDPSNTPRLGGESCHSLYIPPLPCADHAAFRPVRLAFEIGFLT